MDHLFHLEVAKHKAAPAKRIRLSPKLTAVEDHIQHPGVGVVETPKKLVNSFKEWWRDHEGIYSCQCPRAVAGASCILRSPPPVEDVMGTTNSFCGYRPDTADQHSGLPSHQNHSALLSSACSRLSEQFQATYSKLRPTTDNANTMQVEVSLLK